MLYFGLDVQLRRGSVAGYTTDESWAYGPKEGVEAFESITFFIRFIYAINFEHLLIIKKFVLESYSCSKKQLLPLKKRRFRREQNGGKKSQKQQEKKQKRFAYLCIFAIVFSDVLKEPNLRFESAFLTSSKRLFDELIKAL
jgi:hypothetical protein